MTPFAHRVINIGQDVLATTPGSAIHSEIPSMPFTRGIGEVRIALENNPAGTIAGSDIAVVDGALTALLISHRPEPGLKSKWKARVRVVRCKPRHRGCRVAISIVVSRSAIVRSADQRARGRVSRFGPVG